MAGKTVHELEIEFTEWKTNQRHLIDSVDKLQSSVREVKVAVFQGKWMIVGALVFAGLINSDVLMGVLMDFGSK